MIKKVVVAVAVSVMLMIFLCGCELIQNFLPGLAPEAVISITKTHLQPGESVPVSAEGSMSPSGNTLTQFIWNFGDGTDEMVSLNPSHSYQRGGNYTITLVVVDDWGMSSSPVTVPVTVNYRPVLIGSLEELTDLPSGQGFYSIPDGKVIYPNPGIGQKGIVSTVRYTYWKIDSSSSFDPDGRIVSRRFSWSGRNFGSGEVGYFAVPADGDTYRNFELTLIDNEGLKNTIYYDITSPIG